MLKSEYREEFLIAEAIELETVTQQETVTFVDEDRKKHKLKTRMVYDVKSDENGNVLKFKARLVALGYDQRRNEYEEKYAPVARITSIMILLVIGWMNEMDIRLLDFKGAYLHAQRPESTPVYLEEIPGIKTPKGKMNFLNKGLYGTLDAGNLWRNEVEKLLKKHGFKATKNDPCLFIRRGKNNQTFTLIATWVDDFLIVSNDPAVANLKQEFEKDGFEISHFAPIDKYLGMNVIYDKKKKILKLDQTEMIKGLLNKTNMDQAKAMPTPMADQGLSRKTDQPDEKIKAIETDVIDDEKKRIEKLKVMEEMKQMNNIPFRSTLGSLSHLTRMTRPDIQFSTFYHSRYQVDPGTAHWKGLKRILRYLVGTTDLNLTADKNLPKFEMYCDSDFGGDPDEKEEHNGYYRPYVWNTNFGQKQNTENERKEQH